MQLDGALASSHQVEKVGRELPVNCVETSMSSKIIGPDSKFFSKLKTGLPAISVTAEVQLIHMRREENGFPAISVAEKLHIRREERAHPTQERAHPTPPKASCSKLLCFTF